MNRDMELGINKGLRVYILDDPEGNSWAMKSASRIVDPNQTYKSLKNPGSRLKPASRWKFRTLILEKSLVLTPDKGNVRITQRGLPNKHNRRETDVKTNDLIRLMAALAAVVLTAALPAVA